MLYITIKKCKQPDMNELTFMTIVTLTTDFFLPTIIPPNIITSHGCCFFSSFENGVGENKTKKKQFSFWLLRCFYVWSYYM